MNPQGVQPVSGWQGMQPGQYGQDPLNPVENQILGNQNPFPVDPSPTATIGPAGSPNLSALSSIAMLVA
jgi:hypothetical protein